MADGFAQNRTLWTQMLQCW